MSRRRKSQEEAGPGVPAYIVTFSDMVTLLLTFFVMLLSMAENQIDDHKFLQGQSSFKNALADFGLTGAMFSKGEGPDFDHPKVKYRVPEVEQKTPRQEADTRSTDHHTEMLRRIVMQIEQMMKVSPSQISGKSKLFTVTTIRFAPAAWQINDAAGRELDNFLLQMQEGMAGRRALLYVVGLAASESEPKQQWQVSARRAAAVADYLRKGLPRNADWQLFSWGAGPGGDWAGETGIVTRETEILIVVIAQD